MASKNSSTKSEDDDDIWSHRPLKRTRKSIDQFSSSQQISGSASGSSSSSSSSRSTRPGIPQSQSSGARRARCVTPSTIPTPSQLQSNHRMQSRGKIFDSSQKRNKRDSASQPTRTSTNKSGKMKSQRQMKKEISETSETGSKRQSHESESMSMTTSRPSKSFVLVDRVQHQDEYCPMCQAPFSCIHLISPEEHMQDCLEFAKSDSECPEGLLCDVTILSHYQKFSHNLLAIARSEMKPEDLSMMDEDECKADVFTHLKAEVMTSDSDFEKPSSSKPAATPRAFKVRSSPHEDYEYKIDGDRVMCTPKRPCLSQVSTSQPQPQSKLKNTARKSMKRAINRNQRNCDRMPAVKEEMLTPKLKNQEYNVSSSENPQNIGEGNKLKNGSYQSTQTPSSHSKSDAKLGSSSKKRSRRKSSPRDDIPTSKLIFNYFSPSQKASLAPKTAVTQCDEILHSSFSTLETNMTCDPFSVSEHSQPFVESDVDIFALDENESLCGDQNDVVKSEALTASDGKDDFVKLKPKQDIERVPGTEQSLENNVDKLTDEPFFDILDRLEDASDEESESLFSSQNCNFDEKNTTSSNQPNKSDPPNLVEVPPAPVQDDDKTDEELPQFDLTCGILEDLCEDNRDTTSHFKEQGSASIDQQNDQDTFEDSSQDLESKSMLNIPNENKGIQYPTLDHNEEVDHTMGLSEDEESQSLFNIPDKKKEGQCLAMDIHRDELDNLTVCSEKEEEEMEVDDEDEEPTNEERPSVSGWRASDATSALSAKAEDCSRSSNLDTSISAQAVAAKPRKQGTLDSFLGCKPAATPGKQQTLDSFFGGKPAPKVVPPAQTKQPKGQWRGSRQTYQRSNGEGQGQKEWGNSSGKQCPFYKKMPGTSFTVDAFRYGVIPGCKAYFLSHFHYDHYGGLNKHFDQQLYCSKVTGNLVTSRLKVAAEYVINLPMNEPCVIDGVEVTLLDANHCPGSVMFLYKLKSGAIYLHTGDFRADAKMEQYPELSCCRVNKLYLDTTYCDPQYKFPGQKEVIEFAVQTAVNAVRCNKKTLIVCGTYTIGKEKVFRAIAEALACKVYVESQKFKVLECLEDRDLMSLLTRDIWESRLHVIGMNMFNHQKLKEYLSQFSPRYDTILAFKPTGWTHSDKVESPSHIKPSKSGASSIYGIPYSEHSSYSEMKRFVQFLRPVEILPTVNNGNPKSLKAMKDIFKRWMEEDGRSSSPTRLQSGKIKNWLKK